MNNEKRGALRLQVEIDSIGAGARVETLGNPSLTGEGVMRQSCLDVLQK